MIFIQLVVLNSFALAEYPERDAVKLDNLISQKENKNTLRITWGSCYG